MTELATVEQHGSALALDPKQTDWNPAQRAVLVQLGVDKATDGDLQVYHHVCQRTGLDPFARQIYMIERQGKQTIQTGIDGYRLVARRSVDRSRETLSIGAPEWCDADGHWHEVWLQDGPPGAARVTVYRNGEAFPAIALWREYVQTTWKNNQEIVTKMWRSRPAGQLAKCAEALALRKAFPQDLSGIYVDAEMDKADVVQGEVVDRPRSRVEQALDAQTSAADGATQGPSSPESAGSGASVGTPSAAEPDPITSPQLQKIGILCGELGLTDPAEARARVGALIGREIKSRKELSKSEASHVIEQFTALVEAQAPATVVEAVCPECQQGKCGNCEGQAWDNDADAPTDCRCPNEAHRVQS
jgi:phage recombination protein Bet